MSQFQVVEMGQMGIGVDSWHKEANFARFLMVQEGLLKKGSPRGLWEITEAGRTFLKKGGI